jgi:enoyl-CoA hydratase
MIQTSPVEISRAGAVGIVELARPEKFNCLSLSVHAAIEAAIDGFEKPDSGVRAILIRAQGKHFCTGADLDEVKSLRGDPDKLKHFISYGHSVLKRLERSDLPVVAACQGLTLAAKMMSQASISSLPPARDARFGDQHAQFGLIPGWGGSQRMPRIVGLRRGLDLFLSARWIDAATAEQWGLVNYVVEPEQLGEAALAYCSKIATRSRIGMATMKRLARQGMEGSSQVGLQLEEDLASAALLDDDVSEGLAAFEARRTPVFKA